MKEFYIYIVQVNVALLVFYLLYQVLFSRDTFLEIRRLFLLSTVFLSFVYPALSFPSFESGQQPLQEVIVNYAEIITVAASAVAPVQETSFFSWQNLLLLVWIGGMLFLLARMFIQLVIVSRMALQGKKVIWEGYKMIALEREVAPFSFFGWIFLNPAHHQEKELLEIITHESTHVRQWHSLDMVVGELLCVLFWFNPVVWFLRGAIRQNLEFLADKQVVSSGYNRKNYQYHLLRLSHQSTAVQIVNNFNVSPLKKRIIMMNKKQTSRIGLIKYALLLPVTGLLILSANADVLAEMAEKTIPYILAGDQVTGMKGKVVDEDGKPIPGVSVIMKSMSIGAMTDANGNFQIRGYNSGILCFSFVGRKTREIPYSQGTKDLKVVLYKDNLQLDRVVVVGYADAKTAPKKTDEDKEVFVVVEDMPRFRDGNMQQFLAKNIKYPVVASEKGAEGTVYVTFVIDKTGKVTDAKVVKGVDEYLDKEALRVINAMPDWIPGKQRGKAVDVQYTIPIDFMLERGDKAEKTSFKVVGSKTSGEILQVKYGNEGTASVTGVTTTTTRTIENDSVKITSVFSMVEDINKSGILYIVDGKEMPESFEIKSISPSNIHSVTVLKEASATAVYGVKAKNGAIVIETKK